MIKAGSVEVRGLKLKKVAIRNKGQKDPNLEFYTFQPYVSDKVHNTRIMSYYTYIFHYVYGIIYSQQYMLWTRVFN